ncbi:MAG: bifunctional diaminohydroxyphosphoribosylaminopyrimidine deaminase/5-amino-6-(5-phosphoribosylamino)uracil reductase RibD [Peptococcaceae bacterium]|nr:bifunctional diaminohydroxyphosphoribosylaminopyrimidine deaminase/5-amino-6-(5-phosphoribosylamino)uracil reductase RibD [Peptococcaceae bacterium]
MRHCLGLAQKGWGWVNPNPMVGAVIVKEGQVIGEGYHQQYGGLHAERNALANCKASPQGATLYVTLEPCCHYGKTPPCTEAILESGIARVVIGTLDPNPIMAGKSVALLKSHGIAVTVGVLESECNNLIKIFRKYITTGKPFVLMKYAMTLDGKIATHTGASKWISGEEARRQVQTLRHGFAGIMVGVNTILADDPKLTCRLSEGKSPTRIICDSHLRMPLTAQVVQTAGQVTTMIATCSQDEERKALYRKNHCVVLEVQERAGQVDLADLVRHLGEMGIDSVLLEGGGTLNWSALTAQIVDEMQVYVAPKIFGGAAAKGPVAGVGVAFPQEGFQLENSSISLVGEDYLIEGRVAYSCLPE